MEKAKITIIVGDDGSITVDTTEMPSVVAIGILEVAKDTLLHGTDKERAEE